MIDAIYIHIPFCVKKCSYCDFLSFQSDEKTIEKYVENLIKEIRLYPKYDYDTVYFGGGTPSLLKGEQIERILKELNIKENAEVTLELNPKTANSEKIKAFKKAGVNRLSIGIQSFNNKFLKKLGRIHNIEEGIEIYREARRIGFKNISLDLMFSLPDETIEDVKKDMKKLIELNPEHFSIYSLIWEPGTEFYNKLEKGEYQETDNDLEADMYEYIIDYAKKNSYHHYEISNFCKSGYEARHNTKYWRNEEYVGVGLGASGYLNGIRYKNQMKFNSYCDSILIGEKPILEKEVVDNVALEEYRHILGLRLLEEGIIPSDEEKYVKIYKELERDNFLKKVNGRYLLTERGVFLANNIFEKFI
ncbi:radical SAM family heme chaperone HemW [Fusobacterium sp. MFO224]|uniref:radical SAM family heme chaperone HemW n=1 Tax=Fusobacterium sp. MFO224 TaxID=3378070 RepID=UPI0038521C3E